MSPSILGAADDIGDETPAPSWACENDAPQLDALVVGASWAGLWSLHLLKQQGLRVRMVEAHGGVGGVWIGTRYPGCRVDTELPLYEFSMPELWQEWEWSERFPCREEIHRYLNWVCDKLDLRRDILFNTKVTGSHWDEDAGVWHVYSGKTKLASTQFFIPCLGYTTISHVPDFLGREKFENCYHSSQWPEDLDYRGKRVGIVGTAATGIQCIETMAPHVSELVVFQRTPNLATPMRQEKLTPERRREMKAEYPDRFARRVSPNGFDSVNLDRRTFDDTPDERRRFYETLWARGGLSFWFDNYLDLLTSEKANEEAYSFWRQKVRKRISNPKIAEKLAPMKPPHAFGTKRPSLETAYFEVFNQSNVHLVDVKEEPIKEVTSDGITTSKQSYDLDILIYATGYDFITGSMLAMGIRGVDGILLNDKWDISSSGDGVFTQLGLMTAGCPNMFFPMGPQAPSALGLTPHMAEVQGQWINDCIQYLRWSGNRVIEPTVDAERKWKAEVIRASSQTLLGQTDSWYNGVNIAGRKKEPLCYFGGVDRYMGFLDENTMKGYPGFDIR